MREVLWLFAALLVYTSAVCPRRKIVCYWGSWSVYNKGDDNFDTANIDPRICTHLIYAFAAINENSTVKVFDPAADLPDEGGKDGYNRFNQIREKNPGLKTLIGIGGWNEGSVKYSKMVSTAESRKTFVESVVEFVKKHRFNGMDLDWEYPNSRGGVEADKENFVLLLKELRERFDQEGWILSAALAAGETISRASYIIPEISKHLHFINLMAYDFHIISENKTAFSAPLYAGSWEKGNDRLLNVNASVHYWISQGAPPEKIILGMPLYGNSYTLANTADKRVGIPAQGNTNLDYRTICKTLQEDKWEVHFDEDQRVNYAVKDRQWLGYDNARSIREKALLVKDLKLGGAMVWSIESDDFRGTCGQKNILLKTLNEVLCKCKIPLPFIPCF